MSLHSQITVPFVAYVGSLFFISGVLGNILNVTVFYKTNLENPSTFLLFASSCASLVYLIGALLTRVLAVGFNIDPTSTNLGWCKSRTYFGQASSLISLSCVGYALIDQFFVSCQKESWRRRSNLHTVHRVTLIIVVFWFLYMIPFAILAEHVPSSNGTLICNVYANPYFNRYFSYFHQPILAAIIPIIFLITIGILIYRNISLLRVARHRQRVQRNLTSMILFQVIFIIIQSIPYGFYNMYAAITLNRVKSADRLALESVILNIVSVFYYFSHAYSFLIYYISSATYRDQIKRLFAIHRRIRPTGMTLSVRTQAT